MLIGIAALAASAVTGRSVCVFYNVTGVPCPSCGMTRAWLYFFAFDFRNALFFHPLFWIVPVIPFLRRVPKAIVYGCIALFIGVWVLRLVVLFPHTPPMNFFDGALLPKMAATLVGDFVN